MTGLKIQAQNSNEKTFLNYHTSTKIYVGKDLWLSTPILCSEQGWLQSQAGWLKTLSVKSKIQEENMIPHHNLFTAEAVIFESKLVINNFLYCYFTSCQEAVPLCLISEFVHDWIWEVLFEQFWWFLTPVQVARLFVQHEASSRNVRASKFCTPDTFKLAIIGSLVYVKRWKSTSSTVIHLSMPTWCCCGKTSKPRKNYQGTC